VKTSSRPFRAVLVSITALYWIGIFTLTHLPPSNLPKTNVSDKLAHFSVYCMLGVLLGLVLWNLRFCIRRSALLVIVIGLAYGAFDELTQALVGRTCSMYDWYADAGGIACAAVALITLRLLIEKTSRTGGTPVSRK
jgi:VanZ family protein